MTIKKHEKIPQQVLLRIIDEFGNLHVIRRGIPGTHCTGWPYTLESHIGIPESWRKTVPIYFMPITQEEIIKEYAKQGKEWIIEDESW